MANFWCGPYQPWDVNPKLWYKCKAEIAKQMIASGWIEKAKKFSEVQTRKANTLFRSRNK